MFYEPICEYAGYKLVQRPDSPNYYITWCRAGSSRVRRKSTGTSDREEAQAWLVDFAHDRGCDAVDAGVPLTLIDLLADYVERITADSTRWLPEQTALIQWSAFCQESDLVYPQELTRGMQQRYAEWRLQRIRAKGYGGSNGTVNRELRVVRAALNDAWKEGLLEHAPRIMTVAEPPPRQRFLFPDEVERLLSQCHTVHLHQFCMIALHTLQRPGAVLSLHADQVDLQSGLIDFLPQGQAQSRKRRPVVPISHTIRPILMDCIRHSRTGYLIEWQGEPISDVGMSFLKACRRAGLGRDVTPNTLRHTGATLLLAAGVPIREVSGMLGHTEQRTTELYGKYHVAFLQQARHALDELFGHPEIQLRAKHAPDSPRMVQHTPHSRPKEIACTPRKTALSRPNGVRV